MYFRIVKNKKDKTFLDQWLVGEDLQGYLEPWKYAQLNMVERILLAQRVAGEQPQTMRAIADLYDLLPPDVDRFNFLFNTAVQGSVLEAGESLGKDVALHRPNSALRWPRTQRWPWLSRRSRKVVWAAVVLPRKRPPPWRRTEISMCK